MTSPDVTLTTCKVTFNRNRTTRSEQHVDMIIFNSDQAFYSDYSVFCHDILTHYHSFMSITSTIVSSAGEPQQMFHSSTDTERHPSVQGATPDLAVGESHPHFEGRLQSDDQNLWTREAEIRLFAELHGRG